VLLDNSGNNDIHLKDIVRETEGNGSQVVVAIGRRIIRGLVVRPENGLMIGCGNTVRVLAHEVVFRTVGPNITAIRLVGRAYITRTAAPGLVGIWIEGRDWSAKCVAGGRASHHFRDD